VAKDCQAHGLNRKDADYHGRCEFVNVSSVPPHLGCPGQNPESRETVMCMCVSSVAVGWAAGRASSL